MQKTVIYIDAANIILSAKGSAFELDLFKLIQRLKDSYRTTSIIYFTGNFPSMRELFTDLERIGVEMVYKEIYNENNKSKANCDVEISHRITSDILLDRVDSIVLLSGDGDFAHILDFAYAYKREVKVIAFNPVSCSRVIKKRQFTRVSYLVEWGVHIKKEKSPAST